jgi:PiT family inorganic phosphate transporter
MSARAIMVFLAVIAIGLFFTAYNIFSDVQAAGGERPSSLLPYILLAVALLVALGFEFVNGFHDTANAVATVIYTRALPPQIAVVWSGFFNFLGVSLSTGLVAYNIVSLLPIELILQITSSAGFAMVFSMLIAAIIWNLGTWWLGLPASSSHTLIGSIIGVGVMNALLHGRTAYSGVNWGEATKIGWGLLLSPLFGFGVAALLLVAMKALIRKRELYTEPKTSEAPPLWIRGLLILTCTLVSFFHGSNDGQKGMGLIMLILIGTVPTAFALNRAVEPSRVAGFVEISQKAATIIDTKGAGYNIIGDPRPAVTQYVASHDFSDGTYPALAVLVGSIEKSVKTYGSIQAIPANIAGNTRNDMYLTSEAIKVLFKDKASDLNAADKATLTKYQGMLNASTRYIPMWVKLAVALALGLGTMIGWKRIVITVGERIGKTHLTYGQGAAAELVAAGTIGLADGFGLPVSTTHVLSSGIAGTMAANGSGIQWSTLRSIALAWVLTLPCAMAISGTLFLIFSKIF